MKLKDLGPYRVERTDDYEMSDDRTYGEMIRVRGSRVTPPYFKLPSHLYKFSETELALYMKDRKNLWRALGKLLHQDVDIHEIEAIFVFPVSKCSEVARIVPFVKKALRKNPMTEDEKMEMRERLSKAREKRLSRLNQNVSNFNDSDLRRNISPVTEVPGRIHR